MISPAASVPGSRAIISPATWRDLIILRRVEKACFGSDSWPLIDLIGVLTKPGVVRLKVVIGEEMVGFIAGDVRPAEKLAWIATFCVLNAYRRRGIGSMLLQACEDRLDVPRVRLSVRASNLPAIQLYRGFGYQKVGLWAKYYQDEEDAVVMEKELTHKHG